MKCKVTLKNGLDGAFYSDGDLNFRNGGFVLGYAIEGDSCSLSYFNEILTQERKGNAPMKMSFARGKRTECTLEINGHQGKMEIFTSFLDIKCKTDGVEISIKYVCGGQIAAIAISAQKV